MFTEKEGGEGFWRPQEFRDSETSTEGENIQSISISPSGFENLTTPLSRQCSQKKMRVLGPQKFEDSERGAEGRNIQSISISPSGFEKLTAPLSRPAMFTEKDED